MSKIKEVLKKQLLAIKPSEQELKQISELTNSLLSVLKPELKKPGADAMIGGSFAKNTIIKKGHYDIDIFVRFSNKYRKKSDEISDILDPILKKAAKKMKISASCERLKGSRDYFLLNFRNMRISVEIIPILKIKKAQEALNVTDLSPLHVIYIKKKISKNSRLADEIRLAKAFCYANECYGAESYIRGFSGYALELLACYYGSFVNLLKEASKWKQKVLIDPGKFYKKSNALNELNEAKLISPVVVIDPTFAQRNATAALSEEMFKKFVSACRSFLSAPSMKAFEQKTIDVKKLEKRAREIKGELLKIKVKSVKTKEDIAGAKIKKFFNFLASRLKKEFPLARAEIAFNLPEKKADFFFVLKKNKEVIAKGPPVSMPDAAASFKKKWHNCFVKNGFVYTRRKSKGISEIIKESRKIAMDMGIESIKVL